MTTELTITRALAELKHLTKCIEKTTTASNFVTLVTKSNRHLVNEKDFISNGKSQYQSLNDLMKRYNQIKTAIIQSNASTQVKIGQDTYSVAEVIERRQSLPMYKTLLERLRTQRDQVNRQFELNNQQMETDLQKLLESQFSGSGKVKDEDVTNIATPFRESRKSQIVDPLGIDVEITKLTSYIDNFDHEANFVLSESNALTKITL